MPWLIWAGVGIVGTFIAGRAIDDAGDGLNDAGSGMLKLVAAGVAAGVAVQVITPHVRKVMK